MYGDMESHAERYARTREFIAIMHELWLGVPVDHDSPRYPFRGAIDQPRSPPTGSDLPRRSQRQAQAIAAELADVYLVWGDTLDGIAARLATMRAHEARVPRSPRPRSVRSPVPCPRARDGRRGVERRRPPDQPHRSRGPTPLHRCQRERRQRRSAPSAGARRVIFVVVESNLWAGVGLARSGVGVAIVGDPRTSRGEVAGVSSARNQHLHSVGLPASRRVPAVRRDGDAATQATRYAQHRAARRGADSRRGACHVT